VDASLIGKVFAVAPQRHEHQLDEARALGVATLAVSLGEPHSREHVVPPGRLTRISGRGVVAGHALTVWNPTGNNTMIRFGIESLRPGDLIIVSTPSDAAAQWGELATEWASAKGAVAAVIDGAVRDVAAIRDTGVSVWGRVVDPVQALKETPGYVNAPVVVGGVPVRPGDLVVADDDAVLVIPSGKVAAVLGAARRRADGERAIREDARHARTSPALAEIFSADRVEFVPGTYDDMINGELVAE
jgi:4-hydroxy-4-methyl-2-oxoglutarate aldolase